ncbi:MAG: hypothetical protein ACXW30_06960 [Micavibrio sp.]
MKCVPNSCHAGNRAKCLVLPLLLSVFFAGPVRAAEALLPIRATIVNCGSQEERPAKCQKDERCCNLGDSSDEADYQEDTRDSHKTDRRNTAQARVTE